jgi:hypothetical protein
VYRATGKFNVVALLILASFLSDTVLIHFLMPFRYRNRCNA